MECIDLPLLGLKLIKPKIFSDERGCFLETYQQSLYDAVGIKEQFVQDNHSYSKKGCIRGMHFQSIPGQAKLVRVVHGKIFDVAVDIREDSPTFKQWYGIILDNVNHYQLYIPIGFAHGFCALSEEATVHYKVSSPYNSQTEKGFRWDDPEIGIEWPILTKDGITQKDFGVESEMSIVPIISIRDQQSPFFVDLFKGRKDNLVLN